MVESGGISVGKPHQVYQQEASASLHDMRRSQLHHPANKHHYSYQQEGQPTTPRQFQRSVGSKGDDDDSDDEKMVICEDDGELLTSLHCQTLSTSTELNFTII